MLPPATAVAALIIHDDKILLGERITKNKTCWQLPGGYMQQGETPQQAIQREIFEETQLSLNDLNMVALTNNVFNEKTHSVSLIFKAYCTDPSALAVAEPNKCKRWIWQNWGEFPKDLFLPLHILVESGYHPLEFNKNNVKKELMNNYIIF